MPSGAEGRHSLKFCLYVHVFACWYVRACYAYWYVCVLCLLVHMCPALIGTHECYANLYTYFVPHACHAYWDTCLLCFLAHMYAMRIGTRVSRVWFDYWYVCVCFDYWLSENASALIICVNCVASDGDICKSQNRFTVVLVSFIQFEYLIIVFINLYIN